MEEIHRKALSLISAKGPVIPAQLSKELGQNILTTAALLSELVSKNELKISSLKIGGSPLYYLPGQEFKLQNFSNYLHEKEKNAYDLLRQKLVLRDKDQEPAVRVALRAIKDFAKPLRVRHQGQEELFWKWYLLPNKDAEPIIKSLISTTSNTITKPTLPVSAEKLSEPEAQALAPLREEKRQTRAKPGTPGAHQKAKKQGQKQEFFNKVKTFFEKNNIVIEDFTIVKKNTEFDFLITVPSAIGDIKYYCKAKNKKRCSDSDISSAYAQGQLKKLPVLFLTPGELTKKAKELLEKEFKSVVFRRLDLEKQDL